MGDVGGCIPFWSTIRENCTRQWGGWGRGYEKYGSTEREDQHVGLKTYVGVRYINHVGKNILLQHGDHTRKPYIHIHMGGKK